MCASAGGVDLVFLSEAKISRYCQKSIWSSSVRYFHCVPTVVHLFQCENWLKAGCDEEIQPLQAGKHPLGEEGPSASNLFLNLLTNRCICT